MVQESIAVAYGGWQLSIRCKTVGDSSKYSSVYVLYQYKILAQKTLR